jgi:ABC-2 type transport system permease protein
VADVARFPGVIEQLKLVAGLRWTILKNSLHRKNNRWDLIGMIFAAAMSGILVLGLCFAFYAGTSFLLTKGRPNWIALLFWALFMWWQVFPILATGFGTTFEFKNLLRFPLNLKAFYLLGLGYGFADFAAVSAMCWMASMIAGAAVARISVVPMLVLVCALFLLLNVTLERLLGSWLEKVLSQRRSRELFLGFFVLAMVSMNFLSPAMHRYGDSARPSVLQFVPHLWWLPGSLAGNAVGGAATANLHAVFIGVTGLLLWVSMFSALLWLRFKAQYSGEELSEGPRPSKRKKKNEIGIVDDSGGARQTGRAGTRDSVPFLSPQVAGVIAKEFRYVMRNGFSFVTFLLPPIMVVFFTFQFTGKTSPLKEHAFGPELFFPAIMAYLILILLSPAYNSFSFEGKGIQCYFMAPIRFRDVLLGKNLFLVGLVVLELSVSLTVLVYRVGWPTMPRFFATIGAAVFAISGQLTIAKWSSLSFPKKMEIGKMKGQRNSGVAVWTAFGVQILVGGIASVVLLAARWFGIPWVSVEVFAGLTVATLAGYVASLESLDRLAEKKKELLIETLCR